LNVKKKYGVKYHHLNLKYNLNHIWYHFECLKSYIKKTFVVTFNLNVFIGERLAYFINNRGKEKKNLYFRNCPTHIYSKVIKK